MTALHSLESNDQCERFLQHCAEEFLTLPVSRVPEFTSSGASGSTSIHVFDVAPATMGFFQQIMAKDPDRFKALNRGFHEAQPALRGVGWVVTRFAGAVFLSLGLEDEIYVRRVPVQLSGPIVRLAKSAERFLDCWVPGQAANEETSSMPQSLADSLSDCIA